MTAGITGGMTGGGYSIRTSTYPVASSMADVRTVTASRHAPGTGTLTRPVR